MRRWLLLTRVVSAFLLIVVPLKAYSISNVCDLCIVEIQTQGVNSASEDYIVVANNTVQPYDLSGVIIKYWTAGGTPNSKTISMAGSLQPQNSLSFVSDGLKTANLAAGSFPSGLSLADQGGTLRLMKSSTVIDEVSWGTITDPSFAGGAVPSHSKGASLVRKQIQGGAFQDTGDNADDFEVTPHACTGLS